MYYNHFINRHFKLLNKLFGKYRWFQRLWQMELTNLICENIDKVYYGEQKTLFEYYKESQCK